MPQPEHYDILILGSGEGGKYLAWHMARAGLRTAVVERRWIGGSCPNINCLPSKNEIWSAKVATLVWHADRFGARAGPVTVDMAQVRQRKRDMVDGLIAMHLDNYKASGAELVMGSGQFTAPKTLEVRLNEGGTRLLTGDRLFLQHRNPCGDSGRSRPQGRGAADEYRGSGTRPSPAASDRAGRRICRA